MAATKTRARARGRKGEGRLFDGVRARKGTTCWNVEKKRNLMQTNVKFNCRVASQCDSCANSTPFFLGADG